jgi:hypothetical protein
MRSLARQSVLGFVAWGWIPAVVGLSIVVVLLASFALTRNEALSMILETIGYALVLWRTWRDAPPDSLVWRVGIKQLSRP